MQAINDDCACASYVITVNGQETWIPICVLNNPFACLSYYRSSRSEPCIKKKKQTMLSSDHSCACASYVIIFMWLPVALLAQIMLLLVHYSWPDACEYKTIGSAIHGPQPNSILKMSIEHIAWQLTFAIDGHLTWHFLLGNNQATILLLGEASADGTAPRLVPWQLVLCKSGNVGSANFELYIIVVVCERRSNTPPDFVNQKGQNKAWKMMESQPPLGPISPKYVGQATHRVDPNHTLWESRAREEECSVASSYLVVCMHMHVWVGCTMHVNMHVCLHVCICVCMHVCMYVGRYECMCVCLSMYVYIYVYACVFIQFISCDMCACGSAFQVITWFLHVKASIFAQWVSS